MIFYLLASFGVVVVLVSQIINAVQHLFSDLRNIPGPWIARFTSGWYAYRVWQGAFQQVNRDLHQRYGSIVRYAPGRYSFSDLNAVKTIYGLGTSFPKSSWYTTWSNPGQSSLFSERSLARHAHDRKQYQATYSMSSLMHYESFVDNCAELFEERLLQISAGAEAVDMRHWFQCYAFDVIGMITYGRRLGFLDKGEDVGNVIGALEDHLSYATLVGIFPSLHQFLLPLKNFIAGGKGAGRTYVASFTKERMREAQASPKAMALADNNATAQDFLTKFLTKSSMNPDAFTSTHVLAGCVSNMVAGSDTTAISLSATLYYLLKNPQCMQRLREEVDDFSASGRLSARPTYKESQGMPYLQAVIKEALRLHPATGLPLERVVPKGGATIAGRFFPEGAIVGVNVWIAHHDHAVFGPDAEKFSPERWLQDDADRAALMNRMWMPFGLGSRTCIGRHISLLEMCKVIPALVRDFDFALHDDLVRRGWKTQNYWFVKPLDFKVWLKPRVQHTKALVLV